MKIKKIISAILSFILGISLFVTAASAQNRQNERVEISFKVGDSVLMINGEATEVETPYIAGEGTTLVPLRVITEAFGAEVTWVDETKEIYLSCPDVSIVLQIGNSEAKVNSHTETLPEAPMLSPNGVTMVPLRFISETFGAEVGYDEKTAYITVVKGVSDESETMNNMPRVGDSYYGWSVNTPKDMYMDIREFDGTFTKFVDKNGNYFEIYIFEPEEDTTAESLFNDLKVSFSGRTLTMAEMNTDSDKNKIMQFRAEDSRFYYGECVAETDKRFFSVTFRAKLGSDEAAAMDGWAKSFEVGFGDESVTYDLSNVDEDGYRLFEDEEMKVSFKVPAECAIDEYESANEAAFTTNEAAPTIVSLAIYSKTEFGSARAMAEFYREFVREHNDETNVQVSDVYSYDKIPEGDNAYAYTVTTVNMPTGDLTQQIIYFEKGEYVYCFMVTCPVEKSPIIDTIVSSLKTEKLGINEFEAAKLGLPDITGSFKSSLGECELTLPPSWEETDEPLATGGRVYAHTFTDAVIEFTVTDVGEDIDSEDARDWANESFDSLKEKLTCIEYGIEKSVTKAVYGGKNYYTYAVYLEDPYTGERTYFTFAVLAAGRKIYQFILIDDAAHHGRKIMDEFESIIGSLKTK